MHMLRMRNKFLTTHAKEVLYYAQIYSHLSYSAITLGNIINQSQVRKLTNLQQNCMNIVNSRKHMLHFKDIVTLQNLKLGYKIKNGASHLPHKIRSACTTDAFSKSLQKCIVIILETNSKWCFTPPSQNKKCMYHGRIF